ncbi:rhodanese-like domain-containing protein [uncultured Helicobacter sp.]|uniref:rhodanese-like domain-containing protein n=1 Tax=uncultured Helicobacter sp. TaxID=175537 RepID=UPI00374EFA23
MLKHTRWKLFALLFIIVFCVAIAILFWINTPHNATPNKYITLTQAYLNLRNANMSESKGIDSPTALNQNTTQADTRNFEQNPDQNPAMEDALALIQRARASGYELIDSHTLARNLDSYIIIATLPRGIYNLGLIPGAKHFGFAKSPSGQEIGKTDQWTQDALNRSQQEFIEFLGAQKDAKILFYDEGDDIFAPVGSAHTALLWAKSLGYTNLYRLVGGFGAWKALGNPISTQKPHCCEAER